MKQLKIYLSLFILLTFCFSLDAQSNFISESYPICVADTTSGMQVHIWQLGRNSNNPIITKYLNADGTEMATVPSNFSYGACKNDTTSFVCCGGNNNSLDSIQIRITPNADSTIWTIEVLTNGVVTDTEQLYIPSIENALINNTLYVDSICLTDLNGNIINCTPIDTSGGAAASIVTNEITYITNVAGDTTTAIIKAMVNGTQSDIDTLYYPNNTSFSCDKLEACLDITQDSINLNGQAATVTCLLFSTGTKCDTVFNRDTYAIAITATSSGTDAFGKNYQIGQPLIELPNGDVVVVDNDNSLDSLYVQYFTDGNGDTTGYQIFGVREDGQLVPTSPILVCCGADLPVCAAGQYLVHDGTDWICRDTQIVNQTFVVTSGTTANVGDNNNGQGTVGPNDTLHFYSPDSTVNFIVEEGSAKVGISLPLVECEGIPPLNLVTSFYVRAGSGNFQMTFSYNGQPLTLRDFSRQDIGGVPLLTGVATDLGGGLIDFDHEGASLGYYTLLFNEMHLDHNVLAEVEVDMMNTSVSLTDPRRIQQLRFTIQAINTLIPLSWILPTPIFNITFNGDVFISGSNAPVVNIGTPAENDVYNFQLDIANNISRITVNSTLITTGDQTHNINITSKTQKETLEELCDIPNRVTALESVQTVNQIITQSKTITILSDTTQLECDSLFSDGIFSGVSCDTISTQAIVPNYSNDLVGGYRNNADTCDIFVLKKDGIEIDRDTINCRTDKIECVVIGELIGDFSSFNLGQLLNVNINGTPVTFTDLVNATDNGSGNITISGTGTNTAGASSVEKVIGDGYIEATIFDKISHRTTLGLSGTNIDNDHTTPDYGITPATTADQIWIYYGGTRVLEVNGYSAGDVMRITRLGDDVIYTINATTVYTGTVTAVTPGYKNIVDLISCDTAITYSSDASITVTQIGQDFDISSPLVTLTANAVANGMSIDVPNQIIDFTSGAVGCVANLTQSIKIVYDGNSIMAGNSVTVAQRLDTKANALITTAGMTVTTVNHAVGAQTTNDMNVDAFSQIDPELDGTKDQNVVVAFELLNEYRLNGKDAKQTVQRMWTYADSRILAGFDKLFIITMLPNNSGTQSTGELEIENARAEINGLLNSEIESHPNVVIVNLSNDARLSYYNWVEVPLSSDGTHPQSTGHQYIAENLANAIINHFGCVDQPSYSPVEGYVLPKVPGDGNYELRLIVVSGIPALTWVTDN